MFKATGIKQPKIFYTDKETSICSHEMAEYFDEKGIKHYQTRNHAAFAERFIRPYKAMVYKRTDSIRAKNITDPQWNDYTMKSS